MDQVKKRLLEMKTSIEATLDALKNNHAEKTKNGIPITEDDIHAIGYYGGLLQGITTARRMILDQE